MGLSDFFWDAFIALHRPTASRGTTSSSDRGAGTPCSVAYEAIRDIGVARHLWAYDSFAGFPETTDPATTSGVAIGRNRPRRQGGVEEFHATCAGARRSTRCVHGGRRATTKTRSRRSVRRWPPVDIALRVRRLQHVLEHGDGARVPRAPAQARDDRRLRRLLLLVADPRVGRAGRRCTSSSSAHPQWNFCRYKDVHWCGLGFVVERADELSMLPGGRVTT